MATTSSSAAAPPATESHKRPFWTYVALGVALVLAGAFALGDSVMATLISAKFIGSCAIVGGAFEIIHAFLTKGWTGFVWRALLGLLYIALGVVLLLDPASHEQLLTWSLGLILAASGAVRIYLGYVNLSKAALPLFLSGVFGIIAGVAILIGWPAAGLATIGILIGLDLLFQGLAWVAFAWRPEAATNSPTRPHEP